MRPEELYGRLLHALPEAFRTRFGEDMWETVLSRAALARENMGSRYGGRIRLGAFWVRGGTAAPPPGY